MSSTTGKTRTGVFALLLAVSFAGAAAAQEPATDLTAVAFMSGCWEGTFQSRKGPGVMEEHYTEPSQNVMLGTTRYMVDGRTTQFELTVIRLTDDGAIFLTPYPGGERSEHSFRLTASTDARAVFEAPEHDFPKRIIYERTPPDALKATIDDGEGGERSASWELSKCSK